MLLEELAGSSRALDSYILGKRRLKITPIIDTKAEVETISHFASNRHKKVFENLHRNQSH